MKLFIFFIVIVINAVLVFGCNPKVLAKNLLEEVESLGSQINTFLKNVNLALSGLKPIDFGMKNRVRIKQLQDTIKEKAGKPNISTCSQTLDSYVKSVENGFQNMVKIKLSEQRDKLSNLITTFNTMKPTLQTIASEGGACATLNKFHKVVFDNRYFVRDHTDELTSPQIVQKYTAMYVNAPMMEKDEMKIITPVTNCLGTIK